MSLKEKIQHKKELRDYRREIKQRMAEASIRTARADQINRQKLHRFYLAEHGNKNAERQHFAEVAEDLHGLDDHLLMVTGFYGNQRHADKIAEAIKSSGVPIDVPIGISTHEHLELDRHYEGDAEMLVHALRRAGFSHAPKDKEIAGMYTQPGGFSWSLRVGAENTAQWYGKPAQEVFHIAVVGALDTREVGIPKKVSEDGTAHLYRGMVPETGLPVWTRIAESYDPYQ